LLVLLLLVPPCCRILPARARVLRGLGGGEGRVLGRLHVLLGGGGHLHGRLLGVHVGLGGAHGLLLRLREELLRLLLHVLHLLGLGLLVVSDLDLLLGGGLLHDLLGLHHSELLLGGLLHHLLRRHDLLGDHLGADKDLLGLLLLRHILLLGLLGLGALVLGLVPPPVGVTQKINLVELPVLSLEPKTNRCACGTRDTLAETLKPEAVHVLAVDEDEGVARADPLGRGGRSALNQTLDVDEEASGAGINALSELDTHPPELGAVLHGHVLRGRGGLERLHGHLRGELGLDGDHAGLLDGNHDSPSRSSYLLRRDSGDLGNRLGVLLHGGLLVDPDVALLLGLLRSIVLGEGVLYGGLLGLLLLVLLVGVLAVAVLGLLLLRRGLIEALLPRVGVVALV